VVFLFQLQDYNFVQILRSTS